MSSTRITAKGWPDVLDEVEAAKLVKDWVILYHWMEGWPTMTEPKLRVPLPAGMRIGVPTPVRVT
jgi:hypothetical protein